MAGCDPLVAQCDPLVAQCDQLVPGFTCADRCPIQALHPVLHGGGGLHGVHEEPAEGQRALQDVRDGESSSPPARHSALGYQQSFVVPAMYSTRRDEMTILSNPQH